jgi:methyltransferase-like protein
MGNKQTAVEWLLENLKNSLSIEQATAVINKAKEMERQQIMDAVNVTMIDDDLNAYEYFTETYE